MVVDKKNNTIIGQYELDPASKITFSGSNATVTFASKPRYMRGFTLHCANNSHVYIGHNAYLRGNFSAGEDCSLVVGDNVQCSWAVLINAQEKTSITIGDDCLFSNVSIYSSDSHSIFDCETQERINPAKDIKLGDRVWLGRNVIVTKGVNIGNDVAVGAGSLVNRDLPSNSVCAGLPVKVLKTNTVWTQERTNVFPNRTNNNAAVSTKQASLAVPVTTENVTQKKYSTESQMKPVQVLSAEAAFKNLRGSAIYPSPKRGAERLMPLPIIEHKGTFNLTQDSKIFTMGSCFARNIERYLLGSGFNVVSNKFAKYINGEASIQNKYNSASIRQDMEVALENPSFLSNIEASFTEIDGNYSSLHFGGSGAVEIRTKEELSELTKNYYKVIAEVKESDVLIVTLGLVEIWYDLQAQCYLNIAPTKELVRKFPGRYEMRVQSYHDILDDLEAIYGLMKKHMHDKAQMLVTVSPVPLHASFRGQDVLQANTYSKSVQRAAVDEFLNQKTRVNYFPSYEIVALASRERAWTASDFRHVHADMVAHIMSNFLTSYVVDMTIIPTKDEMAALYKAGENEKIFNRVNTLMQQNKEYWAEPRPQFLYVKYYHGLAAMRLAKLKDDDFYNGAVNSLSAVFQMNNRHYSSANSLAQMFLKFGEKAQAKALVNQVLQSDPINSQATKLAAQI